MSFSQRSVIEHKVSEATINIAAAGTNSGEFDMNEHAILALYFGAPGVNTYIKAQSRHSPGESFVNVKKANGTDWQFPDDASSLTAAGCAGANTFSDFVGLGRVRFVAQAAQTGGWTMKVRISG